MPVLHLVVMARGIGTINPTTNKRLADMSLNVVDKFLPGWPCFDCIDAILPTALDGRVTCSQHCIRLFLLHFYKALVNMERNPPRHFAGPMKQALSKLV